MLAVHVVAKHVLPADGATVAGSDPVTEFVGTWCAGQTGAIQFGVKNGFTARDTYEWRNHYHFLGVGRWMMKEFPQRLMELELEHLAAPDGSCVTAVATLLAHGYREKAESDTWIAHLDDVLADPGVTGDARATWLVAKGMAKELQGPAYEPMGAIDWLNEALAEAESEALRFRILQDLLVRLGSMDRGDRALAVLDGIQGQFTAPEQVAAMDAWRTEIATLATAYDTKRAEADALALTQHIDEVQRRLVVAQANNDMEEIARCQQMLQVLQQQ